MHFMHPLLIVHISHACDVPSQSAVPSRRPHDSDEPSHPSQSSFRPSPTSRFTGCRQPCAMSTDKTSSRRSVRRGPPRGTRRSSSSDTSSSSLQPFQMPRRGSVWACSPRIIYKRKVGPRLIDRRYMRLHTLWSDSLWLLSPSQRLPRSSKLGTQVTHQPMQLRRVHGTEEYLRAAAELTRRVNHLLHLGCGPVHCVALVVTHEHPPQQGGLAERFLLRVLHWHVAKQRVVRGPVAC